LEIRKIRKFVQKKKRERTRGRTFSKEEKAVRTTRGLLNPAFQKGRKLSEEHRATLSHKAITDNPLKRPEVKIVHRLIMGSSRIRQMRKEEWSRLRVNGPLPQDFKKGLEVSQEERMRRTHRALTNNPMNSFDVVKKIAVKRKNFFNNKFELVKSDILKSYMGGISFVDTAEKYHISQKTLRTFLKSQKIEIRSCYEQARIKKRGIPAEQASILGYTADSTAIGAEIVA
jgi:hypothetical protein